MLYNIWVTNNCNLCCKYCYEGTHGNGHNMSLDTADKVIAFIEEKVATYKTHSSFCILNFHGGETLLNFKVIKYITDYFLNKEEKNYVFGLTTNGVLLNQDIATYLINNFQYNLSISIDGIEKVHDMNRINKMGEGSFKQVIQNLKYFRGNLDIIRARLTYTPDTVEFLYKSIDYLFSIGLKKVVVAPNHYDNRWNESHEEYLERYIDLLYDNYGDKDVICNLINPNYSLAKGACDGGIGDININYDGTIYPCSCTVENPKYKIGDVNNGINLEKAIQFISYDSDEDRSECVQCGIKHWCTGFRCKLVNEVITGKANQIPYFLCEQSNIMYKCWKRNKEKAFYVKE